MKVLVIAHGHPQFRKGGGEIVAYNQFKSISKINNDEVYFLAFSDEKRFFNSSSRIINLNPNEFLFDTEFNGEYLSSCDESWLRDFGEFLEILKPDVIHLHHYYKSGLESIGVIRKKFGNKVKIFVTLHEFLGICANDGQMIKSSGSMCTSASFKDCAVCSPNRSLQYTLLREAKVKNAFSMVDGFISPSCFLMSRYIDWGIPKDRIFEVENGYPDFDQNLGSLKSQVSQLSFGFFGQFTPYKGLDIFIDAALIAHKKNKSVSFYLYGGSQQSMGHEFEKKISDLKSKSDGVVSFMGKYDESNVVTLMSMVDVVVIPSRWWENSPVIIDEARAAGVPMLVSNHGGMKEKVVDAGYGWPFLPGSSASLANEMLKLIDNPDLILSAKSKINPPTSIDVVTNRLLGLYGK